MRANLSVLSKRPHGQAVDLFAQLPADFLPCPMCRTYYGTLIRTEVQRSPCIARGDVGDFPWYPQPHMSDSLFHEAIFLERKNRFLALLEVDGHVEGVHLPNSGRLSELLIPGARALVREKPGLIRKTAYDLWGMENGGIWVCVDARHANDLFVRGLQQGLFGELAGHSSVRREVTYGTARLDFAVTTPSKNHLVEVKSCTLVEDGCALFPDAPTERGTKHLKLLTTAAEEGASAGIAFMVQRDDARIFSPHQQADPAFAVSLRRAVERGVWVAACAFEIGRGTVGGGRRLPVVL